MKIFLSLRNFNLGQEIVKQTLNTYSKVNGCSDELTYIDIEQEQSDIHESSLIIPKIEIICYVMFGVLAAMIVQLTALMAVARYKNQTPYN